LPNSMWTQTPLQATTKHSTVAIAHTYHSFLTLAPPTTN
jgi:hypothetical protein